MNTELLKKTICSSLCADVELVLRADGYLFVTTPFTFDDGDHYSMFLKPGPSGVRVTDRGTTMMHLSYANDLKKFKDGTRGALLQQIVQSSGFQEEDGEFFIDVPGEELGSAIVRFGQGLTRIHDLTFLNRVRVQSTFYEDLKDEVDAIVGADQVKETFFVPNVPQRESYPVDLYIPGERGPLFIFGVPDQGKARLATIIIQYLRHHLQGHSEFARFKSMVVFQDQSTIPHLDRSRLLNAASSVVDTLQARDEMRFKIDEALH
ncbi:DUF1828 domain-containing protein [Rhodanobacter glycinis]|jgi:hypothetical protein|uniref:DUF1828 domain-containing protein n=1 Tax=Rhodanobacter glycinis TaxID=582702 RepID=A0A1I4FMH0_9GAMM|nr:DUF1828 domain-containing protein [Rhodanobacter glycinis]SFL18107.1 protein of unknown function DUF1828 [Rhodanobacter glycinis]